MLCALRGCRLSALLLSPFALLRERDMDKESEEAERLEQMRALREEGKSYREIAQIMECSPATVHKYLAQTN